MVAGVVAVEVLVHFVAVGVVRGIILLGDGIRVERLGGGGELWVLT